MLNLDNYSSGTKLYSIRFNYMYIVTYRYKHMYLIPHPHPHPNKEINAINQCTAALIFAWIIEQPFSIQYSNRWSYSNVSVYDNWKNSSKQLYCKQQHSILTTPCSSIIRWSLFKCTDPVFLNISKNTHYQKHTICNILTQVLVYNLLNRVKMARQTHNKRHHLPIIFLAHKLPNQPSN